MKFCVNKRKWQKSHNNIFFHFNLSENININPFFQILLRRLEYLFKKIAIYIVHCAAVKIKYNPEGEKPRTTNTFTENNFPPCIQAATAGEQRLGVGNIKLK